MPYKIINKFCVDCGRRLSRPTCTRCRDCNNERQKQASQKTPKEYQHEYFQTHKQQIYKGQRVRDTLRRYSRYKITEEQVQEMYLSQGKRCAICQSFLPYEKVNIDHDHDTQVVRGLLCTTCNLALGQFKDSIPLLESAINYLKENWNMKILSSTPLIICYNFCNNITPFTPRRDTGGDCPIIHESGIPPPF